MTTEHNNQKTLAKKQLPRNKWWTARPNIGYC